MLNKVKVLLVDDELPALSKMYIDLLLKNYEVEATQEAGEVLARIRRFQPDVVILSPSLSGLDGYDLCHAAKEQGFSFILLEKEGACAPLTIGDCKAAAVLKQPVDLCQLAQQIGNVLV